MLGVVPLANAQLAEWHLTVSIHSIPQNTGNIDVQIYGPHSSDVLISETINGDQTGSASAGFNIAGSDIGFGDDYKICVSGQSGSPACFAKIHHGAPNIIENLKVVNPINVTPQIGGVTQSPDYHIYNDPRDFGQNNNIEENMQNRGDGP